MQLLWLAAYSPRNLNTLFMHSQHVVLIIQLHDAINHLLSSLGIDCLLPISQPFITKPLSPVTWEDVSS